MALRVHGAGYSVYSRILRLGLIEKGVTHEWVEVDVFDDAEARAVQLTRHPFGKIPSLDHDGFVVFETGACLRYLEQPAFGPVALIPRDPKHRAGADQIAGIVSAYGYRAMVWDVFVELVRKPAPDQAVVTRGLAMSATVLDAIEDLAGGDPFLVGDAPSFADIHLAPVLAYFVCTACGPEMLAARPRIAAWWGTWRARPSMIKTRYPMETR